MSESKKEISKEISNIFCSKCGYLNDSTISDICELCYLDNCAKNNGGCAKFTKNKFSKNEIRCGLTIRGNKVFCNSCKKQKGVK